MIPDQVIPIQFGQGLDTKSDPKTVVPGKLLRLQDAIQVAANEWRKRNGYQQITLNILGGGTLAAPKMIKSYQDELVCADSGRLYSYSTTQNAWVDKGAYVPVAVKKNVISRAGSISHEGVCGAASGNIAVYAWVIAGVPTATVIDLSTNTALISDFALASANTGPYYAIQCILMGSGDLAVFYFNASNHPAMRKLVISGASASFSAEVQLNTDTPPNLKSSIAVCATATGAALCYGATSTTYKVLTVNSLGSVTASATLTVTSGSFYVSAIVLDSSTGNLWIYYVNGTNNSYAVLSSSLATILAPTTLLTGASPQLNFTALAVNATTQTFIYSVPSGSSQFYNSGATYKRSLSSAGTVGSASLILVGPSLYSEPFTLGSDTCIAANTFSPDQATQFIVRISDGLVIAKSISGSANDYRGINNESNTQYTSKSWSLVKPIIASSSRVLIPCGETYASATTPNTIGGAPPVVAFTLGCTSIVLDTSDAALYQAIEANDALLMNGGIVWSYDGTSTVEAAFLQFPEVTGYTLSTGGSMALGAYEYFFLYRWVDSKGNVWDSAPSSGLSVTLSGTDGQVSFNIPCLGVTQKKSPTRGDIEIRIYRTTVGGAASSAKYVGSVVNGAGYYVAFTDTNSDASISYGEPIYTAGGTVENISPPPALAFALHKNRAWLIDSENPNTVWYAKTFTPNAGVNFSDLLQVQVDAVGGDCVALAGMDDKLVIFEERLPLVMAGDGANDIGTGSTLSDPQPIPADTGCSQSKGVITFPGGVLCKTLKGLYLLDRALGFTYFGAPVEAFNSQKIVSSTILETRNQIYLLTDSGSTLVYDYFFQQWSTFTNHAGYAGDNWNGVYVYARTDGKIYKEVPGYYLDDTAQITPLARLSWLAFSGIQGFQRIRRFLMLGSYVNGASAGHGVQVSAAYDFNESFSAPIPFLFGNASTSGPFQYRERLPIQKCDSISLILQEVTTGDSAEYIAFTNLSFQAGIKRGLNKLSQTRSVG